MGKFKVAHSFLFTLLISILAVVGLFSSLWIGVIEQVKENRSVFFGRGIRVSFSPITLTAIHKAYIPELTIRSSYVTTSVRDIDLYLDFSSLNIFEFRLPLKIKAKEMIAQYGEHQKSKKGSKSPASSTRKLEYGIFDILSLQSISIANSKLNLPFEQTIKVKNLQIRPRQNKINKGIFKLEHISLHDQLSLDLISGNFDTYIDQKQRYVINTSIKNPNTNNIRIFTKISSDFKLADIEIKSQLPLDWISSFTTNPVQQSSKLTIRGHANKSFTYRLLTKINTATISHPALADRVLDPLSLRLELKGTINGNKQSSKHYGNLAFKRNNHSEAKGVIKAAANVNWEQLLNKQKPLIANIWLPSTTCKQFFSALPRNALNKTPIEDISGNLAGHLSIAMTLEPQLRFTAKLKHMFYRCKLNEDQQMHSRNFLVTRKLPANYDIRSLGLKPQLASFISNQFADDLGLYLPFALIAAEDTGFLSHNGIEPAIILSAMKENINKGSFKVGGSTISMQVAKNLYLTKSKHISRKLQEIILALDLESKLSKKEILYIYANIIEFGPGLFGITEASKQMFDKKPKDLNLEESLYLASSLPNPVRHITHFCAKNIAPDMQERMTKVFQRYKALKHRYGQSPAPIDFDRIKFFKTHHTAHLLVRRSKKL